MTVKNLKDVAASVRQRLLNKSKEVNQPFEEIARRYAMERFLYRLGLSEYRERLILKGALMLAVWKSSVYRPTFDIDLLGLINNDAETLEKCIRDICSVKIDDDGIIFDPLTVKNFAITKDMDYTGRRIQFTGKMGNMRIPMQIDIGFGDTVFPRPERITVPSFIDMPFAQVLGYTRESSIAEKYHAMVQMADINSRMKDFYDIWILSQTFDFSGRNLSEAIKVTFGRRGTLITDDIVAFEDSFIESKQKLWQMFLKRGMSENAPKSFHEVVRQIEKFLRPVILFIIQKTGEPDNWKASGDWLYE